MVGESGRLGSISDRLVDFRLFLINYLINDNYLNNYLFFYNFLIIIAELLSCTHTGLSSSRIVTPSDVQIIFLQALDSGLMRVRLQGPVSRINLATPLIDGMVVPRRALGSLVRQTALNMGRRKRLDNDR